MKKAGCEVERLRAKGASVGRWQIRRFSALFLRGRRREGRVQSLSSRGIFEEGGEDRGLCVICDRYDI